LDDETMLTVFICAAALLAAAGTGGRIRRLAEVQLRHVWLLWAALAVQIVTISVIPDTHPAALSGAHVASYLAAGVFLLINRRLPGVWLIGTGGALNGVVITLNGGTLPASAAALQASGQDVSTGQFNNSAVLADPYLPMLGDVFATPAWLPTSNVFSLGDVAIWLGVIWFLWRTCRPQHIAHHAAPTAGGLRQLYAALREAVRTTRQRLAVQNTPEPRLAFAADVNGGNRGRFSPARPSGSPGRHRRSWTAQS
jgi:hypothetical protein